MASKGSWPPISQWNGQWLHHTLKKSLVVQSDFHNWAPYLPLTLLSIRTENKANQDCSPAELSLDTTLRLPGDFVCPNCQSAPTPSNTSASWLKTSMCELLQLHADRPPQWVCSNLCRRRSFHVLHDSMRKNHAAIIRQALQTRCKRQGGLQVYRHLKTAKIRSRTHNNTNGLLKGLLNPRVFRNSTTEFWSINSVIHLHNSNRFSTAWQMSYFWLSSDY